MAVCMPFCLTGLHLKRLCPDHALPQLPLHQCSCSWSNKISYISYHLHLTSVPRLSCPLPFQCRISLQGALREAHHCAELNLTFLLHLKLWFPAASGLWGRKKNCTVIFPLLEVVSQWLLKANIATKSLCYKTRVTAHKKSRWQTGVEYQSHQLERLGFGGWFFPKALVAFCLFNIWIVQN